MAEVVNSTLTIRTFQKNFVTELEDNGLMDSVFKASSIYKVVTFTWFEIYADALVNVFISAVGYFSIVGIAIHIFSVFLY